MIHILSIGINRHIDQEVNDLSLAVSDATAIHSLLEDSFKEIGVSKLLVDQNATKDNILHALDEIKIASTELDTVIVYYSGHGSETYWLIPNDFSKANPFNTSIPMEDLVSIFSEMKCKLGLVLLDCCFSGEAGSKVFNLGLKEKSADASNDDFLNLLSAKGKVIVTASNQGESAWENMRLNHGIFTYHLIRAMSGDVQYKNQESFTFQEFLDYIVPNVQKEANLLGKVQTPTYKCNIEGNVTFPILRKGAKYNEFFPEERNYKTDGNIEDLVKWGITQPVIDIYKNKIEKFNQLQIDAINDYGLFAGDNLIVSAPTSSGKTLIGELAAVKNFFEGKKSIFLLPMKSLVNDKYFDLQSKFGGYGLRIIRSTGDRRDQDLDLKRGKFDLCLMTYEKFGIMLSQSPFILNQLGLILIDELQMINDRTRGVGLEVTMTLLRLQAEMGISPQIIGLSGVIGNLNGLDEWMKARYLKREKRPIPLEESVLTYNGDRRVLTENGDIEEVSKYVQPVNTGTYSGQMVTIPLVKKLLKDGERIIIFRAYIPQTIATARYLINNGINLPPAKKVLDVLPLEDQSNSSKTLHEYLQYGIAFHNSNLTATERELIESDFRDPNGDIKLIIATTTLAMGINTPADSVIIADLERFTDEGTIPFTIADYKNMIGRAGRLGFSVNGKSYIITESNATLDQKWRMYVCGAPEDVVSQFNQDKTEGTLVSIVSFLKKISKENLRLVYFDLFGNYQGVKAKVGWDQEIQNRFTNAFQSLIDAQVFIYEQDNVVLSELGKISGEEGVDIHSVVSLSKSIQSLGNRLLDYNELIFLTLITDELNDFYFPVNSRGEAKEKMTWTSYAYSAGISNIIHLGNTAKILKMFAAIHMYISGKVMNEIEIEIQKHNPDRDFSGKIRGVSDRAKGFVNAVAKVSTALNPQNVYDESLLKEIVTRMELGIPTELLPLSEDPRFDFKRWELIGLKKKGILSVDLMKQNLSEITSLVSKENFVNLEQL